MHRGGGAQVIDPSSARRMSAAKPEAVLTARGAGLRERPHAHRTRVFHSGMVLVENLEFSSREDGNGVEGFSPEFQVCLPYAGLFVWQVDGDCVVADANQVLFVRGGEPFHVRGSIERGYGELIVTPAIELLAELAGMSERGLRAHPLFCRRSRRVSMAVQVLRARLLHSSRTHHSQGLAAEELVLTLLRSALQMEDPSYEPRATTRRMLRRAKEFVEANFSAALRLDDVARAVNASPAYLTDVFRRAEGVSLHRYIVQLRLARALVELPHVTDLTTLALDLGFSSHSHFAAAFRRAFGCTPSEFRESTRGALPRRIA
jgi:AraC family transcriptional regulator